MSLLYEITQNQNAKYLHLVIAALFQITMNYVLFAYLDGSQQNSNTNVIQTNTVVNFYMLIVNLLSELPLKHFYSIIHYAYVCPPIILLLLWNFSVPQICTAYSKY